MSEKYYVVPYSLLLEIENGDTDLNRVREIVTACRAREVLPANHQIPGGIWIEVKK